MIKRRKDKNGVVLKEGEYQKRDNLYEYRWTDRVGNRRSIYASNLKDLRKKQEDILKNTLDGIDEEGANLTVNDLYKKWKKLKRGIKENTFNNYVYMFEQYVQPEFGKMKIVKVKRTDVRSFYNGLKDNKFLKVSTIDTIHNVLHQVLDLAVDDDYIRYNPASKALKELKTAGVRGGKKKALTLEEQKLFEDFLNTSNKYQRFRPVFTVMLHTGMRVGEVTGLQWSDIDLEKGFINISKTLVYYSKGKGKGNKYAMNTPKTNAGVRKIPIIDKVREAFIMERDLQNVFGITCEDMIDGYSDFVFLNRFGKVHNYSTLNKALSRIVRDCNFEILDNSKETDDLVTVPTISNHILRHTFTTRLNESDLNIKVIQTILGHSDISTTMDIYTDVSDDFLLESAKEFNLKLNEKMYQPSTTNVPQITR